MEENNSNNGMKIDELKEEIENLREEKDQALLLLEQKQSEVDCAAAWAEAASEAVNLLQERLDATEKDLREKVSEIEKLKKKAQEDLYDLTSKSSLKTLVDELQKSHLKEAEMFKQQEAMQGALQDAHLEVDKYKEYAKQYQSEIAKLKAELEVERKQSERMMAESSEIEATWANYNKTQAAYEKTLKNQIKQNGSINNHQYHYGDRRMDLENSELTDRVMQLEMMLAEAKCQTITERNKAMQLNDENRILERKLHDIQQLMFKEQRTVD